MSEYRVEKRREAAELTLPTGAPVAGYFFLSGSSHHHTGPERVGDVLNVDTGFFPFESEIGETALYNRAPVLTAARRRRGSGARGLDSSGTAQDASSNALTRQEILQLIGPIVPEQARRRLPQETSV